MRTSGELREEVDHTEIPTTPASSTSVAKARRSRRPRTAGGAQLDVSRTLPPAAWRSCDPRSVGQRGERRARRARVPGTSLPRYYQVTCAPSTVFWRRASRGRRVGSPIPPQHERASAGERAARREITRHQRWSRRGERAIGLSPSPGADSEGADARPSSARPQEDPREMARALRGSDVKLIEKEPPASMFEIKLSTGAPVTNLADRISGVEYEWGRYPEGMMGHNPSAPKVRCLQGPSPAKQRLKTVLETIAGYCRVSEACERLNICEQRFHQLRQQVLEARRSELEPRLRAGRMRSSVRPTKDQPASRSLLQQVSRDGPLSREIALTITAIVPPASPPPTSPTSASSPWRSGKNDALSGPPRRRRPWQEEEHVRRLQELCQSPSSSRLTTVAAARFRFLERCREEALRGTVARLYDDLQ